MSAAPDPMDVRLKQPGFLDFIQFSLREYLTVLLLAGAMGCVCYTAINVGFKLYAAEMQEQNYRYTRDTAGSSGGPQKWHDSVASNPFVDQNCVDFAMRQSARLPVESVTAELSRMNAQRQAGDVMVAYEMQTSSGRTRYAYLLRNEIVIFTAVKTSSDLNWVERCPSGPEAYFSSMSQNLQGIAIFTSMIVVVFAAFWFAIMRALYRYMRTRLNRKARSAQNRAGESGFAGEYQVQSH